MKKKRIKRNLTNKNNIHEDKRMSDTEKNFFEDYVHSIEIREKRIGIVFKVIYVLAVFLATLMLMISDEIGKELSTTYNIEMCITAFLLCLLLKMLIYIFNELKCFKLNGKELTQQQVVKTEDCYVRIFDYFLIGGMTSLFMIMAIEYISLYLTLDILKVVFLGGIILGSVIDNAQIKKYKKLWQSLSDIIWTIVIVSVILVTKLGETI